MILADSASSWTRSYQWTDEMEFKLDFCKLLCFTSSFIIIFHLWCPTYCSVIGNLTKPKTFSIRHYRPVTRMECCLVCPRLQLFCMEKYLTMIPEWIQSTGGKNRDRKGKGVCSKLLFFHGALPITCMRQLNLTIALFLVMRLQKHGHVEKTYRQGKKYVFVVLHSIAVLTVRLLLELSNNTD